jgi:hypothetical protein
MTLWRHHNPKLTATTAAEMYVRDCCEPGRELDLDTLQGEWGPEGFRGFFMLKGGAVLYALEADPAGRWSVSRKVA